jgi:phospholipase C
MTVAGQRVSQGFFERREPRLVVAPLIEARAEEPTTSATMSRTASCRRCPGSTVSIENELVTNATPIGPIGLGVRVPFLAVSPWSKGGYVNSEVFDHTSVIQFIEKRFGVHEINISPWRRAVTGDLTSVFNFVNPNASHVNLPSTDGYLPPQNELAGGNVATFEPTLSGLIIGVPKQERGVRPARALPYQLDVRTRCGFQEFGSIGWKITNAAAGNATVTVVDAYSGNKVTRLLRPHESFEEFEWSLRQFFGWYDLVITVASDPTFEYRLAGHVETGRDSYSDPAMGGLVSLKA